MVHAPSGLVIGGIVGGVKVATGIVACSCFRLIKVYGTGIGVSEPLCTIVTTDVMKKLSPAISITGATTGAAMILLGQIELTLGAPPET
jgi:hypothetical protein